MSMTSHILHTFGVVTAAIVILTATVFLIAVAISNAMDKQSDLEG